MVSCFNSVSFFVWLQLNAAGTVLYRTFTFNDCPEAAKELQEQIQEARKDLTSKGFTFRDQNLSDIASLCVCRRSFILTLKNEKKRLMGNTSVVWCSVREMEM